MRKVVIDDLGKSGFVKLMSSPAFSSALDTCVGCVRNGYRITLRFKEFAVVYDKSDTALLCGVLGSKEDFVELNETEYTKISVF